MDGSRIKTQIQSYQRRNTCIRQDAVADGVHSASVRSSWAGSGDRLRRRRHNSRSNRSSWQGRRSNRSSWQGRRSNRSRRYDRRATRTRRQHDRRASRTRRRHDRSKGAAACCWPARGFPHRGLPRPRKRRRSFGCRAPKVQRCPRQRRAHTVSKILCRRPLRTSRCYFAVPVAVAAARNEARPQLHIQLAGMLRSWGGRPHRWCPAGRIYVASRDVLRFYSRSVICVLLHGTWI